jgi:hypothetical protein
VLLAPLHGGIPERSPAPRRRSLRAACIRALLTQASHREASG